MKLAIANQKGGVGKTTTAVNLSACLGSFGYRTLLIDLDPQGNATSGLGIDKRNVNPTVYDVLTGRVPVEEAIITTEFNNLYLLPANINLTLVEAEFSNADNKETALANVIEPITSKYEFLIIDTPPSLGLLTVNGLVAADAVIIPVQCEYYALEALAQLLSTIDLIKKSINPKLRIAGLLLTMADYRTNLARQVEEEVRSHFPEQVYKTVIPRNVRLAEAPSFGKPIIIYDKECLGSISYLNFSKEVIENEGKTEKPW